MNKLIKYIGLASILSGPILVTPTLTMTKQEINLELPIAKNDNFKEWRLEKLPDLSHYALAMTTFNHELYILKADGGLSKIDSQGKRISVVPPFDKSFFIRGAMAVFDGELYFGYNGYEFGELYKINKQNNVTHIKKFDYGITALAKFNGFLYISAETHHYKIDKQQNITDLDLEIRESTRIRAMKVFNNKLYFAGSEGLFFSLDRYENLTILPRQLGIITTMEVFNDELYFGTNLTQFSKVNKAGKITFLGKAPGMFHAFAILNNELYFGLSSNYLWKLGKQNQLVKVVYISKYNFNTMYTFNQELYISHDDFTFSKLTNK